jgi:hypothetical protein
MLAPSDLATYRLVRGELANLLLSAQRAALPPWHEPRRTQRVAWALQVEIGSCSGTVRAMTLQLSSGGFGALLANAPRIGEDVTVALRIPGGRPLRACARVVAIKERLGNANTSFRFMGLEASDVERLEMFVCDALLEQFKDV